MPNNQLKIKEKHLQPTPGDRAFVYQQACDLTQPVGILMDHKKNLYCVTFILDPLNRQIKVVGEGKNFISAGLRAKKKALQKMALAPGYNYEEKELLVNILKHNISIH